MNNIKTWKERLALLVDTYFKNNCGENVFNQMVSARTALGRQSVAAGGDAEAAYKQWLATDIVLTPNPIEYGKVAFMAGCASNQPACDAGEAVAYGLTFDGKLHERWISTGGNSGAEGMRDNYISICRPIDLPKIEIIPLYTRPAPAAQPDILRQVLETVREYPDFDDPQSPFGQMIDEALAGKVPHLFGVIDALADGRMPPAAPSPPK